MLWSEGRCHIVTHQGEKFTPMGIEFTSFRGNWFVHPENRKLYEGEKVNRGGFELKTVVTEILYIKY